MNFRKLTKIVDTSDYYFKMIDPKILKAQYNPERFHLWKSLHNGPKGEELNMIYSPHYRFLRGHKETYPQLQKYYGRNNKWIESKIKKFLGVFKSIKNDGFTENLMILEKPLVKNKYNNNYEIFEGHHRTACALFLNLKEIPCQIIRRKK